jgi:hypothetical protein
MLKFLIEAFKASKGRMPNNLEMLLLRQKATNQAIDERKVVNIFDRSTVNPNKTIIGGKNIPETEDDIRRRLLKNNEEGIASMKSKLEDPEKKAKGGRIGLFKGAQADTKKGKAMSPGTSTTGSVRDDNPFTGGGGGGNNNNPPPVSTNNTTPDTTFFDKTSKSGLMSNISPSILARLARIKKGITPILGEDVGLQYQNIDEINDIFTNFRITQDLENLIKTKKLEPELKYRKEIGDNTLIEGGINQAGDANIMFKKQFADGGRIGYKLGTGKKGVEGLIDLIRNKFGKKSITTADKAPIPPKTLERNMFKKADENFKNKRMLTDDEYQDFLDEVGGADQLEAYDFDGTVGDAKRIIREQKRYMDDMELEYKKGNLDPEPGDKSPARKRFLEKKLEEMEASGDKRLMTIDEIEELSSFDLGSEMDVAKTLAPKMVERMQLKQKYPGITDDLLDKILIDDNMQRKAEVLATIDEAFKMMEKGKGTDEILDTMKNVTRTKQADGGITRVGYKAGSVDKMRRLILKAIGAGTAGIGAAKSGIFSFGKGAGKEVTKEVVQKSTTTPPPYFFKLAEKIKMMGNDATATTDRTIAKTLDSKDGKSTYLLEEDVTSGDTIIKKINKEGDEMITDVEIMDFKKGEVVMGKNGKPVKTPDNYEEVTEANARIEGDVFNDPYYSDGIKIDEIMKEVGEQAPSIKKADGGIMRAGYQVGGDVAFDASDKDIYGSSAMTVTPDTIMDAFGNQVQAEMGNDFNKPLIPQVTKEITNRPSGNVFKDPITGGGQPFYGEARKPDLLPVAGGIGGLPEIDMPIAGGNNNAGGILPVMPQLPGFRDDTNSKLDVPQGGMNFTEKSPDMSDEDIMKGFAEYQKQNPYSGPSTQAVVNLTLPGGTPMSFRSGAGAAALRQYLQSIGMEAGPGQGMGEPLKKAVQPGGTLAALASGGIARMLGE